jgi:hypothetical protein
MLNHCGKQKQMQNLFYIHTYLHPITFFIWKKLINLWHKKSICARQIQKQTIWRIWMNKKIKKCAFKCTTNVNTISNYMSLSIYFYHSTKSFQFLNSCEKKIEILYYHHRKWKKLPPTTIDVHCKSLIDKYKNE